MADQTGLVQRWDNFKASKAVLFWACVGSVVATLIIGFGWGGWVTGRTADQMAAQAGSNARAQLAAAVCVDRFRKGPDATAQLASLRESDSWKRDRLIDDGGWTTLAGMSTPVAGAASLCVQRLLETPKTAG